MKIYINFENTKGNYDDIVVEAESMDTIDIINAILPEVRTKNIAEILEIFEDDEDPYADYRINPED